MINVTEGKEDYHDEEGNPQVDCTAHSEHRHSDTDRPRSNIMYGT